MKLRIGCFPLSVSALVGLCFASALLVYFLPKLSVYKPIGAFKPESGPFFHHKPQMGTTLVGLACSGGGSRAAYLTAAILSEIHRSTIRLNVTGESKEDVDLLDQLDYVSSVSGGSLSASYFVLHRSELRAPADSIPWRSYRSNMAIDFRPRQWFLRGILNPATWVKVMFTNYNRGNIAREHYNDILYKDATIADLPARPALYINASDVFGDSQFVFSSQPIYNSDYADTHELEARRANDLSSYQIDPQSIKIADAVYASSAFPFAYPVLSMYDWLLRQTAHFDPGDPNSGVRFLADGGLLDNSGLMTLFNQFQGEFTLPEYGEPERPRPRLVLAIAIDASISELNNLLAYPHKTKTIDYASADTYLGQGTRSVEIAYDRSQDLLVSFLERNGVALIKSSFASVLSDEASPEGRNFRINSDLNSWPLEGVRSKDLLLRPSLIDLSLADAPYALAEVSIADPELDRLLSANGLDRENMTSALPSRIGEISTDFTLSERHRQTLDLAAYLLVHGVLEPRITAWAQLAEKELKRDLNSDSRTLSPHTKN
jgi:predicted acylesterase/phospholipase RssA